MNQSIRRMRAKYVYLMAIWVVLAYFWLADRVDLYYTHDLAAGIVLVVLAAALLTPGAAAVVASVVAMVLQNRRDRR